MSFAGVHTALVTPFRDGTVDDDAFRALIDRQFAGGASGVVPVGTTGESPTLSHDEHERVIELAIEYTDGRGHVIAGTGSNATSEAVSLTKAAEKAGATASLQVCPYYNKPSQEGLYRHFRSVAEASSLPIILYSIPGRAGVEIGVETAARLAADCSNIVAIKEAGGSVERVSQLVDACPESFQILSGDDSLTLPFMAAGAVGVVSVASNLVPDAMSELVRSALASDWENARRIHRRYYPLFAAFLKLDSNPVPIKAALQLAGHVTGHLRLPLVPLTDEKCEQLRQLLMELDILS